MVWPSSGRMTMAAVIGPQYLFARRTLRASTVGPETLKPHVSMVMREPRARWRGREWTLHCHAVLI